MTKTAGAKQRGIGVLAGNGALAGAYAHSRLVRRAAELGAERDLDFPWIAVGGRALGMDETGAGPADAKELAGAAERLLEAGVDWVLPACNTIDPLLDDLRRGSDRILSLPERGAAAAAEAGLGSVCILSSRRALQQRLHARALEQHGIEPLAPEPWQQEEVHRAIRLLIAGRERQTTPRLLSLVSVLPGDGVLLGCTELSMLHGLLSAFAGRPVIDCLEAGVEHCLTAEAPAR